MPYELNRRLAARRPALPTNAEVDTVTAGIVRGAFETICFEVATHVARTATSAMINQSNERNASIIDAHGRLAGLSVGIPQLMFISPLSVRYALEHKDQDDWGPGDVFVGNDPYAGGGHLPDYNVFAPVFDNSGELLMLQAIQCHQGDTGGKDPGGFSPDALDLWAEGLIIPGLKLLHRGKPRRDVMELLIRNNRLREFSGDIWSMIGAAQLGARKLQELVEQYGADVVKAAINTNIDITEKRFREQIKQWPDGDYEADVYIDHDPAGNKDIHVHVNCKIAGDGLTVDFTGTDARPELAAVWNTFSNTRGYAAAQLAAMIDPSIPKNEGLFDAINLVVPEGSILNPPDNKPVVLGAFHPAVEVGEAICIALSSIVPERASPQVYKIGMPNVVFGFRNDGSMWMDSGVDVRGSDASAVQDVDGWGSMCSALGNLILQTAEEGESTFPVRHLGRELTTDTGGAGKWRGQPGTKNIKQLLEPGNASCWMVSMAHPLRGMQGGHDAAPYGNRFMVGTEQEYAIDNAAFNVPMPAGAVMAYQYGGGGGFGNPLERDPEAVKEDVLDELVSLQAARSQYGVVLVGELADYDLKVDHAATDALRREMATSQESA
ncbi:MAG TPA: methylhydantoinase [Spongiibacteraceae bacterium]|nr:methylhydantoinase [Spongiibacteraceae bacterium]